MSPLRIIDDIAIAATWDIPDAVSADINEADRTLEPVTPKHLIERMETAAVTLADRSYLAVYDAFTSGQIDNRFAFSEHFDEVMTSFNNRMYMTMMSIPSLPRDWPSQCSTAIAYAFSDRITQLGMQSGGGVA